MGETITDYGYLAGLVGYDDDDPVKVAVDEDGHLQVDGVTTGNPPNLDMKLTDLRDDICVSPGPGGTLEDVVDALALILTELLDKLETADLTSATTRYINAYGLQYTGSAWVKSNLLWGYNDRYAGREYNSNLSAGAPAIYTDAVPDGYVYVIKSLAGQVVSASITGMWLGVFDGTQAYFSYSVTPPVSGRWYATTVDIPLKKDDKCILYVEGATAGDDADLRVWGYKMQIAM